MSKVGHASLIVWGLVAMVLCSFGVSAEAAPCPVSVLSLTCIEVTEASGVTNLKETVITPKRDGVALTPIVIPASAPTGGGVLSSSLATIACADDTYTAEAFSNYTTTLGVMSSLVVQSITGARKDRTGEAICFKVPGNPTIH